MTAEVLNLKIPHTSISNILPKCLDWDTMMFNYSEKEESSLPHMKKQKLGMKNYSFEYNNENSKRLVNNMQYNNNDNYYDFSKTKNHFNGFTKKNSECDTKIDSDQNSDILRQSNTDEDSLRGQDQLFCEEELDD